jgi:hypothetical protein
MRDFAAQEATQAEINALATDANAATYLCSAGSALLAEYPQYDGEFETPFWALAVATRRVRSKGGVQFEKGDYLLVDERPFSVRHPGFDSGGCELPTAFSIRLGWHCAIRPTSYKIVRPADA